MIHLLPLLRFPRLRRRRPVPAPVSPAQPPEPAAAPVTPKWSHRPPEPFVWAERCGWCGDPVPDNATDPEFCKPLCAAAWLRETNGPTYGPPLPPIQGCAPPPVPGLHVVADPAPEPAWMARITAWERAKAERLIAERKAPAGNEEAA